MRFIFAHGAKEINHPSETNFYTHSTGVHKYFLMMGSSPQLALAGLFHSIYGAQGFEDFALPLDRREEISRLIGADAEKIVYLYCATSDESLQESLRHDGPPRLWDRFKNCPLQVSTDEFDGLLWLTLIDVLEQDLRRIRAGSPNVDARWAPFLRRVSERLGPTASWGDQSLTADALCSSLFKSK